MKQFNLKDSQEELSVIDQYIIIKELIKYFKDKDDSICMVYSNLIGSTYYYLMKYTFPLLYQTIQLELYNNTIYCGYDVSMFHNDYVKSLGFKTTQEYRLNLLNKVKLELQKKIPFYKRLFI